MIHVLESFHGIRKDTALKIFREDLMNVMKGLSVDLESIGIDDRGWGYTDFSGADSEVLKEIIRRRYGIAQIDITRLEVGDITRGIIVNSTVGYGIYIDIGLRSSKQMDALYPLHAVRSQLADGEKLPLRQISKRFCLQEGFPLEVRVTGVNIEPGRIDVELSDREVSYFKDWTRFPFDRVILIGCSKNDLERAIDLSELRRDIADVDSISLTTHVLLCKLGTDAPGVISRIGLHLRGVGASAFQPRRSGIGKQRTW
jgi:hypothetical protein